MSSPAPSAVDVPRQSSSPAPTRPNFEQIPQEMRALPHWVLWRAVPRGKVPIRAGDLGPAKSNDPSTWTTFEEARRTFEAAPPEAGIAGVGFVFTEAAGLVGIDLDSGLSGEEQDRIVRQFSSYAERSPSGRGVHIQIKARKPGGKCRRGNVEVYSNRQFFTVTGARLPEAPATVEERQAVLDSFYAAHLGPEAVPGEEEKPRAEAGPEDEDLEDGIVEAAEAHWRAYMERPVVNGARLRALWEGAWESLGYRSQSEADLALCSHLVSCFGPDRPLVDALFGRSGLMRPKWDEFRVERTYGEKTLDAIPASPPGDAPAVPWRSAGWEQRAPVSPHPARPPVVHGQPRAILETVPAAAERADMAATYRTERAALEHYFPRGRFAMAEDGSAILVSRSRRFAGCHIYHHGHGAVGLYYEGPTAARARTPSGLPQAPPGCRPSDPPEPRR